VKKTIVAVALAVVFVMSLAVPAFAQMTHSVVYELDGTIDFKKQAGHLCNTGAAHKQTIQGSGEMFKESAIVMVPGRITMDDTNDFVAGETNLAVISVIELCAPPKYMYEGAVVHPSALYTPGPFGNQPYTYYGPVVGPFLGGDEFGVTQERDADPNYDEFEPLTKQIWAAHVNADPGFSGNLHQDFVAAYGPFWGTDVFDHEDGWTGNADRWRWETDADGVLGAAVGVDYVGNYFNIEQHQRTSQGTIQRFIDISSPWNHGYLMEDATVVGKSDVQETFTMSNLPEGADIEIDWWVLF